MFVTFLKSRGGNFAQFGAILSVPVIFGAGMLLDVSRLNQAKSAAQHAVDSAALYAADFTTLNDRQLTRQANRFFRANFDLRHQLESHTLSATRDSAGVTHVTVDGTIERTFAGLGDWPTMNFSVDAAVGAGGTRPTEVALVVDLSYSMRGQPIADLRAAAEDFVRNYFAAGGGSRSLSVIPYANTVNVGTDKTAWIDPYGGNMSQFFPGSWGGCLDARTGGLDVSDTPPTGTARFDPYIWRSGETAERGDQNVWPAITEGPSMATGNGPNVGCLSFPVLPLTSSESEALSYVRSLDILLPADRVQGTMHSLGLTWGWRTVSPNWATHWQSTANSVPSAAYGSSRKVMIFMTDGRPYFPPQTRTGYGFKQDNRIGDNERDTLATHIAGVCDNIKAADIELEVVVLNEDDANFLDMLRDCSSRGTVAYTENASELGAALVGAIGTDANGPKRLLY